MRLPLRYPPEQQMNKMPRMDMAPAPAFVENPGLLPDAPVRARPAPKAHNLRELFSQHT